MLGMFESDAGEARALFQQFVQEGKKEGRRPDLSGEGLRNMGREIEAGFGDVWRISGPILGNKEFAAKVLSDLASMDEVARTNLSASDVIVPDKPSLEELIGVTCAVVGLKPWEFEQRPKRRGSALARRIIAYLWVQRFQQPQIALVRHFCVSTGAVSRWVSKAVREIAEIEPICDDVVANLPNKNEKAKTEDPDRRTRFNLQFEQES